MFQLAKLRKKNDMSKKMRIFAEKVKSEEQKVKSEEYKLCTSVLNYK